jgi:hypothetical protein
MVIDAAGTDNNPPPCHPEGLNNIGTDRRVLPRQIPGTYLRSGRPPPMAHVGGCRCWMDAEPLWYAVSPGWSL